MRMMRILIAEKNRAFRAEFVELVTHCHPAWQIVETADAIELRARLAMSRFDLVFLDLGLPGLHTHLSLGGLRQEHPHTKVVGLGDTNDCATIIRCFEDGLGGYISRTCSGIKLIRTLKVIATPDLFISTGSSEPTQSAKMAPLRGVAEPAPAPLREAAEMPHHPLTARQADVLNLLAEGRSTKDIARRLGLAVPTVKTHLAAVYRQLGARNRLQAVVKASALASSPSSAVTSMVRGMTQTEMFERNFAAG
jgi:DNA-binding NarL/FixJ family response regulator